jgi:hypothetical protein
MLRTRVPARARLNSRRGVTDFPPMAGPPELSIKGTAFMLARRDVLALVEAGRISRPELERRLDARDLPFVDETPLPASWYPIATYDRLLRVLMELEGAGETRYLVQRARKGMEALMRGGLYKQLAHAEAAVRQSTDWFERTGHILATLPTAFFDKGSWRLSRDQGKRMFTLEGSGLEGMTLNVAHIVQGAVEYAAEQLTQTPVEVTIQRPREGRVVFVGRHG